MTPAVRRRDVNVLQQHADYMNGQLLYAQRQPSLCEREAGLREGLCPCPRPIQGSSARPTSCAAQPPSSVPPLTALPREPRILEAWAREPTAPSSHPGPALALNALGPPSSRSVRLQGGRCLLRNKPLLQPWHSLRPAPTKHEVQGQERVLLTQRRVSRGLGAGHPLFRGLTVDTNVLSS